MSRRMETTGFLGGRKLACVVSQVVAGNGAPGEEVRGQRIRATRQGKREEGNKRKADGQVGGGGLTADCSITEHHGLSLPSEATGPAGHLGPPQPSISCLVAEVPLPHCHHGIRARSLSRLLMDPMDAAHSAQAPGPGPGSGHGLPWSSALLVPTAHTTPQLSLHAPCNDLHHPQPLTLSNQHPLSATMNAQPGEAAPQDVYAASGQLPLTPVQCVPLAGPALPTRSHPTAGHSQERLA